VTILGPEEVQALGMGSLYSVSQGSDMKAHLLVARWAGSGGDPIALVGKGNSFDTGGYNLKTDGASILRMHTDKAGGAAVVGAVQALAGQEAPVHVVGVVPLSINMISGDASLPGDVVTAGDGSTIEIGSTDAEGRLILADGIWYAREHLNARVIVDIATLTGAKVGALGTQYSALFTRDARLEETLRAAGELTGERVWPLPLAGYEGITRSRIADQINTGTPGAQAGAIFLEHFAGRHAMGSRGHRRRCLRDQRPGDPSRGLDGPRGSPSRRVGPGVRGCEPLRGAGAPWPGREGVLQVRGAVKDRARNAPSERPRLVPYATGHLRLLPDHVEAHLVSSVCCLLPVPGRESVGCDQEPVRAFGPPPSPGGAEDPGVYMECVTWAPADLWEASPQCVGDSTTYG
jgi:hypothetical protein